jgi:hypothetical protein
MKRHILETAGSARKGERTWEVGRRETVYKLPRCVDQDLLISCHSNSISSHDAHTDKKHKVEKGERKKAVGKDEGRGGKLSNSFLIP